MNFDVKIHGAGEFDRYVREKVGLVNAKVGGDVSEHIVEIILGLVEHGGVKELGLLGEDVVDKLEVCYFRIMGQNSCTEASRTHDKVRTVGAATSNDGGGLV